ncbi:chromatin-remodeling ATPase INO80-like isoform X2 [Artemia franciscana]|uniref:Chromatin-remodeling ATPase INO80 n=2 Tax=Artemia franciscana TaxID=6661 RepID=A0AA88I7S5_ARTSF|nr:hypothetical protein QYM36_007160 [Artemia franciscana]
MDPFEMKPGPSRYTFPNVPPENGVAVPLQLQRLEKLIVLNPYLDFCESLFRSCLELSDHTYAKEEPEISQAQKEIEDVKIKAKAQKEKLKLAAEEKPKIYNFDRVGRNRKWLQDILLANSSEDEALSDSEEIEYMKECQQIRDFHKKKFVTNPEYYSRYKHYGAGVLSTHDRYIEVQDEIEFRVPPVEMAVLATSKSEKTSRKQQLFPRQVAPVRETKSLEGFSKSSQVSSKSFASIISSSLEKKSSSLSSDLMQKKRGRKRKDVNDDIESLTFLRRKIWSAHVVKDTKKAQKAILSIRKDNLTVLRRLAVGCSRIVRQKALQSEKAMKETTSRCKRISKEIQSFWRRTDKVEKTQRKQAELEAREQRRLDLELMEAKRQQRKLNFLITQTELYGHFVSRKLGGADPSEEGNILGRLEEEKIPRLQEIDHYDSEAVKQEALRTVSSAFRSQQLKTRKFDTEVSAEVPEYATNLSQVITQKDTEYPQPLNFKGTLKHYQLKGMNWIADIYNQGINGILADEMGLGKTVQSIAFLAHVAERFGIWGPFLIISPTSTLHNWQQEFSRFVPDFKVIPYWGSPQERKILRQFWSRKNLHTKESTFHVVITSYQMIVSDYKYFQRIKWQYMILDEAQAIKSSASARWKTLLGFNCRNRLLLSGTPIQNNMAELWALLHFIMPTLFDSHDEFSEWFSKDIESTAEAKGTKNIDEKHLTRLHLILKPFMLRRIKKDVENELSEKIEIMLYCPLTSRQKALYNAVKQKIKIEDLLYSGQSTSVASSATSNLMNIVMQLRKVCNHPELFERRDVRSPFNAKLEPYQLSRLVFQDGILSTAIPSKQHILEGKLTIWRPDWIIQSLFPNSDKCASELSFLGFLDISIAEVVSLFYEGIFARLKDYLRYLQKSPIIYHESTWHDEIRPVRKRSLLFRPSFKLSPSSVIKSPVMSSLVFCSYKSRLHEYGNIVIGPMKETIEHRMMRTKKKNKALRIKGILETSDEWLPEISHIEKQPVLHEGYWLEYPNFLYQPLLKASAQFRGVYCSDRCASWKLENLFHCSNQEATMIMMKGCLPIPSPVKISFSPEESGGISSLTTKHGWSKMILPDKRSLIADSGKMRVLDALLKRLKDEGHRVLIYSQMTRVIDLLEEFLRFRHMMYLRLDGSSSIAERRDMVSDFQSRSDIFVFLLSTRAGGLGLNLTAADTVIFYDSDWNPTVDEQAMDRAHRLGQTKQVTVYRLICKGTVEERILERAREKSEIQRMVISGGQFKPEASLKPKEVVSLLLDDEEIENKYRQRRLDDEFKDSRKRKGKRDVPFSVFPEEKRLKTEPDLKIKDENGVVQSGTNTPFSSAPPSPVQSETSVPSPVNMRVDDENETSEALLSQPQSPSLKSPSITKTLSSSNLEFDVSPLLPGLSHRSRPFQFRGVGRRGRPCARTSRGLSRGSLTGIASTPNPGDSDDESPRTYRQEPSKRGPGRPRTRQPTPANHVPRARGRPKGSSLRGPVGLVLTPSRCESFSPSVLPLHASRLSDDENEGM